MLRLIRGAAAATAAAAAHRGTRRNINGISNLSGSRSTSAASKRMGGGDEDDDDAGPPAPANKRRRPSFVVAVDGPAASGKGTLSRRLAQHFRLRHLDTGLLYRAVGAEALRCGADLGDQAAVAAIARSLDLARVAGGDDDDDAAGALRTDAAAQAASRVSALPEVRAALLQAQRDFAAGAAAGGEDEEGGGGGGGGGGGSGGGGAVLDGRDIGTVVCPRAAAKIFVTASAEVRARRRFLELQGRRRREGREEEEKEEGATLVRVFEDLTARDARDAGRAASPLRAAEDALVLDTSGMDAEAALEAARAYVEGRRARWREEEGG